MALALVGCGSEPGPTRTVLVSEPVPICPSTLAAAECDGFEGGGVPEALAGLPPDSTSPEALGRRTGLRWKAVEVPADPMFVDLERHVGSDSTDVSAWVAEVVETPSGEERLLAVGSRGGTGVWVDGERLVRSRFWKRSIGRHGDVARVHVGAGSELVLYRVNHTDRGWRLYREWWEPEREHDLLVRAAEAGAWADLLAERILPDGDTLLGLRESRVALGDDTPVIRFRWRTLLGEPLGESPRFLGPHPPFLPLPDGFDGAAVVEIEVRDPATDALIYRESQALFTESPAARLLDELVAVPPTDDPVHVARLEAVRSFFGLEGDPEQWAHWRAHVLADLYRVVHDPDGYARHGGAQVWGYRREWDGGVEPFWLAVPPDAVAGSGADPRPLVFSVNHFTGPYWTGRGARTGDIVGTSILGSAQGAFSVIPHVGGEHEIALHGAREIPAITRELARHFPIDTSRVVLEVWSQHAGEALRMALDPGVSFSHLFLMVPDVRLRELDGVLDSLAALRPGLDFLMVSAANDEVVTPELTRALADALRERGLRVEHVEVPHSTHSGGLLYEPGADLYRAEGAERSGAAGMATDPKRP